MKKFQSVQLQQPKKSVFDLGFESKLTCKMGDLVPIYMEEVVPGDVFKVRSELMLRMSPLVAPVMHRVDVFTHFFFVPNRLIWNNWELFATGGPDGTNNATIPVVGITNGNRAEFAKGTLADYLGIPSTGASVAGTWNISALPFRAYQQIYNDYYRDQNLQTAIAFQKGDSGDTATSWTMRKRCWEKDYFTSALPWTQRGSQVNLPIANQVVYKNPQATFNAVPTAGNTLQVMTSAQGTSIREGASNNLTQFDNISAVNSNISVNELRRVTKLQQWLERNATGGARYAEQILAHFGVRVPDFRLQRAEYLGGGKSPVVISEVLQTAEGTNAVGTMRGHGISVGSTHGFKKEFDEHGYIIGIMSVLPKTAYGQGIPKTFLRQTKFDLFWPLFANLGEQEVKDQELYANYTATQPVTTFGYQERYAEYKFRNSEIHGDFRDSLNMWHMGRIFGSAPALNSAFVSADPTTRIYAVQTGDTLWCQIYNDVQAIRTMPYYGTPSF